MILNHSFMVCHKHSMLLLLINKLSADVWIVSVLMTVPSTILRSLDVVDRVPSARLSRLKMTGLGVSTVRATKVAGVPPSPVAVRSNGLVRPSF